MSAETSDDQTTSESASEDALPSWTGLFARQTPRTGLLHSVKYVSLLLHALAFGIALYALYGLVWTIATGSSMRALRDVPGLYSMTLPFVVMYLAVAMLLVALARLVEYGARTLVIIADAASNDFRRES